MNTLAQQIINDDGDASEADELSWHFVDMITPDHEARLLCTGEYIDAASSSGNGSEYVTRHWKKGGVTCQDCLKIIKQFKAIKL